MKTIKCTKPLSSVTANMELEASMFTLQGEH